MDTLIEFLTTWGYWGMLIAAFIAGSFFPFSSEAVMLGLIAAGLEPWQLMVYGTVGNILGSMFNYGVGRLGRPEWIERYLHVPPEQMERALRFMQGRGALMGVFAFLPVLGSAIAIGLGLMRANVALSFLSISVGKALRYMILVWGAGLLM